MIRLSFFSDFRYAAAINKAYIYIETINFNTLNYNYNSTRITSSNNDLRLCKASQNKAMLFKKKITKKLTDTMYQNTQKNYMKDSRLIFFVYFHRFEQSAGLQIRVLNIG